MHAIATTRILHTSVGSGTAAHLHPWVWPLPRLDGATPRVLSFWEPSQGSVDIGYQDRATERSPVPVFAVQDGIVSYAATATDGALVCLDHAGGWSTQYSILEHLPIRPTDRFRRRRKERVRAGDLIGHVRRSTPRIRFALSRLVDDESATQDPFAWMTEWSMLPWFDEAAPVDPLSQMRSTC